MRSFIHCFLLILGAVICFLRGSTVRAADSEVDLVTLRAVVIVDHGDESLNCTGTLLSNNIVYTTANCIIDKEGKTKKTIKITLVIDGMRTRKVEKIFYPPAYLENRNTTLMCDKEENKCAERCLRRLPNPEVDQVQNYALLLLEEPFPLCEKHGDAVAARLDTSPLKNDHSSLIDSSIKEECFMTDTKGSVSILRNVFPYVGRTHPECETRMLILEMVDKSEYIDPSKFNSVATHAHCTSNDGRAVQMRFLATFFPGDCAIIGFQTARHASEVLAVVSAWGEHDNYKRSQDKCSTFLEQNPYYSVKEKYMKISA